MEPHERWIRDDPNGDPSALRFEAGNLVMYKRQEGGWIDGEVLKVCQRLEIPREFGGVSKSIAYIVYPHCEDAGGNGWVEEDSNDWIRLPYQDLTPNPNRFRPHLTEPEDPLSHLYTGFTSDPCDEEGTPLAESFSKHGMVADVKTNADGSMTIKDTCGRSTRTAVIEIPQEPILGVEGFAMIGVAQSISRRRQIEPQPTFDFVGLFKSAMPTKQEFPSLRHLEEAATHSNEKLLQLGDALMSGVHRWPRDPMRACNCYCAAAWGCQEDDGSAHIGIPVGLPEAMVQYAEICRSYFQQHVMGLPIDEIVDTVTLLQQAIRHPEGNRILGPMFFFAATSVQRGWITPFALDLAEAAHQINLLQHHQADDELKATLPPLLQARAYKRMEQDFQKMQESGRVAIRGDPSNATIEKFSPHALAIYESLPVSTSADTITIHLEYREVPRPPFPHVVYAILTKKKVVLEVLRLPEHLQFAPFSQESFRWAWLRIAFELHLGIRSGNNSRSNSVEAERTRPKEFTILDAHGNQQFASFLQQVLGATTRVRLVSHQETIKNTTGRGRNKRTRTISLGEIVHQVERQMLEIPGFLTDNDLSSGDSDVVSGAQEEFVRQYAKELSAAIGDDEHQIIRKAEQLKGQGNDLFTAKDHNGASRCYSIAIQLLQLLVNHNSDSFKLLGTLLSNRAACYLELENQRSSNAFRKLLAQRAIRDCAVALQSSWTETALPSTIRDKLKFRQDKAMARYDALQMEFESAEAPMILSDSTTEQTATSPQSTGIRPPSQERALLTERHQRLPNTTSDSATNNNSASGRIPQQPANTEKNSTLAVPREFDALVERGQTVYANSLAKNSCDGCPICIREFQGELSHTLSTVLPCGEHAICVQCICQLKKQSDRKEGDALACPLCRVSIQPQFVEELALQIIELDPHLASLVLHFPTEKDVAVGVAQQLLWKQNFQVDAVVDIMEGMLDDRASAVFFREQQSDLNYEQKNEIYLDARQPVNLLQAKLKQLEEERRTTFDTNRLVTLGREIHAVRAELTVKRTQARNTIYEKHNSAGGMGAHSGGEKSHDTNATVMVDFHGLHVDEMHVKFAEHVLPILPAVKQVTIITGRGLHSASGESKLKKQLLKRIEREEQIRWGVVPNNPGAVNVLWQEC